MAKKKPARQRTARKKGVKKTRPKQAHQSRKSGSETSQRLQRVMAAAGIGSRRECELIIEEGRVEVDGQVVTTLGIKVDPNRQKIYVDAQPLVMQRLQYFMLNKPPGVLSTSKDPSGRPRVIDLIKTDQRVYNVGRLDQSSEGLILVTNDGDLANQLTHPRFGVEKKYHVQVVGVPEAVDLRKLEQGVHIAEGLARATKARFLKRAKGGCWLEIVLAEGRNREIRRMLAGIGHKVRALKRVSIGPLKLGELPRGAHRPLTPAELKALKRASSGSSSPRRTKSTRKRTIKQDGSEHGTSKRTRKTSKRSAGKKTKAVRASTNARRGAGKGKKKTAPKSVRGAKRKQDRKSSRKQN